ncbi:HAD-IA family hydrolase [Vibrio taketomensis]|uniref:HAD-IA family hydrolase n=1 Tax=Vibrio taketomensis TaxID=2572923 RepID=UPI001389E3FB|nr:HAD-IA family hydrolase [Vibrio taketomensis]
MSSSVVSTPQPVRCVIFDCDGTLIDSEKLCIQAIHDVFASHDVIIALSEIKNQFQGVKIHLIMDAYIRQYSQLEHLTVDDLIDQYRRRSFELFETELQPIDGVYDVLENLTKRGIDVCIASNAPIEKMQVTLPQTKLEHYFEGAVYSAYQANSWKPEAGLIEYVMKQRNVTAEECLFIDDSVVGVQAGVAANVRTLYFVHDEQQSGGDMDHSLVTRIQTLKECLLYC